MSDYEGFYKDCLKDMISIRNEMHNCLLFTKQLLKSNEVVYKTYSIKNIEEFKKYIEELTFKGCSEQQRSRPNRESVIVGLIEGGMYYCNDQSQESSRLLDKIDGNYSYMIKVEMLINRNLLLLK